MIRVIRPRGMFTFLHDNMIESTCGCNCFHDNIPVQNGDIIEKKTMGGLMLTLKDGTVIKTPNFMIVRLPEETKLLADSSRFNYAQLVEGEGYIVIEK